MRRVRRRTRSASRAGSIEKIQALSPGPLASAKFGSENTMSFMDMRQWITLLEKERELRRITAEVDWDREIGAVARRVLEKKGPALLFERSEEHTSELQ